MYIIYKTSVCWDIYLFPVWDFLMNKVLRVVIVKMTETVYRFNYCYYYFFKSVKKTLIYCLFQRKL